MCDDTLNDATFALNLINCERYLSSTKWICSPRLEHPFSKRSLAMTAHVGLLCCSTVSCRKMPQSITVFILCVIPLNGCPFLKHFEVAGRGSPHLKLLALVTPYSGNPTTTFDIIFSFGFIPINKCTFLPN